MGRKKAETKKADEKKPKRTYTKRAKVTEDLNEIKAHQDRLLSEAVDAFEKNKLKLVYVAGKYRSKSKFWLIRLIQVMWNIHVARKYAIEVWKSGKPAICPHSNSALFDFLGVDDDIILPGCVEMMLACDEIHVLPGAEFSTGTQHEIKLAISHGLKVTYVEHLQ